MDRLTAMEAFVRVVETGSFTRAAGQLRLSRAMVSKYVQELENRLGVRLLNRTTRRLSLTEAGAAYYERCARIVADAAEADQVAARLNLSPQGLLKIKHLESLHQVGVGAERQATALLVPGAARHCLPLLRAKGGKLRAGALLQDLRAFLQGRRRR